MAAGMSTGKPSRKADQLQDTLQLLDRLTTEAGQVLDALGHGLYDLTTLTAPIHSRATALTEAQRNIAATKAAVDELLEHLDTSRRVLPVLEAGPARDLAAFLDGLQQLERSHTYLQRHQALTAVRQALGQSQAVFERALQQCSADFASTLADGSRAGAPEASWVLANADMQLTEENRAAVTLDLVPMQLLPKLRRMAEVMLEAQPDAALEAYAGVRRRMLAQLLRAAGPETPPLPTLQQLASEQLDRTLRSWAQQLRILALLAVSEARLADAVWGEQHAADAFARVLGRQLRGLLQAGRNITDSCRAPDKVFSLLDLHLHLKDVAPTIHVVLDGFSNCATMLAEVDALMNLIGSTAANLFGEYMEAVSRDAKALLPPDGTIHPLTAQVMSYVKRLLTYENASRLLFGDGGTDAATGTSAMRSSVERLLSGLFDNLASKSRAYQADKGDRMGQALGSLFLMNNSHYIIWCVEGSSHALSLLGEDWLERHKDDVEKHGADYHDVTWMPLVNMLQADTPSDVGRIKIVLKERFTTFNTQLERIYTTQSGWTIPDAGLRAAVRRVIKTDVLPPYQDFLRSFADVQFTSNPGKYIKYAASDVASIVDDDLFECKVVSLTKRELKKEKLEAIM